MKYLHFHGPIAFFIGGILLVIILIFLFSVPKSSTDWNKKSKIPIHSVPVTETQYGKVVGMPEYYVYEDALNAQGSLSIPTQVGNDPFHIIRVLLTGNSAIDYRGKFLSGKIKIGDKISFYLNQITEYETGPSGAGPHTVTYGVFKEALEK